jgi:hypothetical protein
MKVQAMQVEMLEEIKKIIENINRDTFGRLRISPYNFSYLKIITAI